MIWISSLQRKLNTRTVDVIFTLADDDLTLLAGDLLALNYHTDVESAGIWVPKQALNSSIRGLFTLLTVLEEGQQHVVNKAVEVLYFDADRGYVRGALSEQDYIVVNGTHRLAADQLVLAKRAVAPLRPDHAERVGG